MISKSELIDNIEDAVAILLESGSQDRDNIINFIRMIVGSQYADCSISEQNILTITKRLETRFDVSMGVGTLIEAEGYTPWLDDSRENIDWYYWPRYKKLLPKKKFNREVINVLDIDTNKIIDHLENPMKPGGWKRKGLCVGHVQSGKTANYLGVICKAADAGYKVIIVLAGLLNSLRNQTQERIDEGFVGRDSSLQLQAATLSETLTGVGKLSSDQFPVPLTTSTQDFDRNIATQLGAQISQFHDPVIFVLKKNVSILRNLIDWLKNNNSELNRFPMLLIDDEADHASVNTSKDDEDPTATNSRIRELLGLFEQSSYLGYTATPFANIFIDPESDDEMLQDDLFPRDFIISLDTPTNYVGASRIFEDSGDLDIVREVDDYEDILPLSHKKDEFPAALPSSLHEAIRSFILVKVMRNLRGQENSHNSMLINVSRFTDIQSNIKWQVHEYLNELRQAINHHYALPEHDALQSREVVSLRKTWDREFSGTEFSWADIQPELKAAVSPVHVIEVNGSRNAEELDYNKRDYPNGRNVIAIGGLSLSRGLTLEGLTVSYFLRNSKMYDTLMQMGRWFGYRSGFDDICRVYMTEEALSWYSHISRVTDELREEFRRMEKAKMTPGDFGLCVRSHPESLIVTARNKMRTGRRVPMQVSLEGRLVETSVLFRSPEIVSGNLDSFKRLMQELSAGSADKDHQPGCLYRKVPAHLIVSFIESFDNHPASQLTEPKPLIDYIEWLSSRGTTEWDVVAISPSKNTWKVIDFPALPSGQKITPQGRTIERVPGNGVGLKKRRLGSSKDEKAGLSKEVIQEAESAFKAQTGKKSIPGYVYRGNRKSPLLMLHVLDCREGNSSADPLFPEGIVAYGVSFPGVAGSRRPERLVEYVVNTVWWNSNYGDLLDENEEE